MIRTVTIPAATRAEARDVRLAAPDSRRGGAARPGADPGVRGGPQPAWRRCGRNRRVAEGGHLPGIRRATAPAALAARFGAALAARLRRAGVRRRRCGPRRDRGPDGPLVRLEFGDGRVDRQPGGRRQGARGGVRGNDREPAIALECLAGKEPEIDPGGRDPRARRDHQAHPGVLGGPDPCRGGRDLVVHVQVEDVGHRAQPRPSSHAGRAAGLRRADPPSTAARSPARPGRAG